MKPETRDFIDCIQRIESWLEYLKERVASGTPWPNSKYLTRDLGGGHQLRVWPPVNGEWLVQIASQRSRTFWRRTRDGAAAEGVNAEPRLAMTIALLQLHGEDDEPT